MYHSELDISVCFVRGYAKYTIQSAY